MNICTRHRLDVLKWLPRLLTFGIILKYHTPIQTIKKSLNVNRFDLSAENLHLEWFASNFSKSVLKNKPYKDRRERHHSRRSKCLNILYHSIPAQFWQEEGLSRETSPDFSYSLKHNHMFCVCLTLFTLSTLCCLPSLWCMSHEGFMSEIIHLLTSWMTAEGGGGRRDSGNSSDF